jgi:hypothetical protein
MDMHIRCEELVGEPGSANHWILRAFAGDAVSIFSRSNDTNAMSHPKPEALTAQNSRLIMLVRPPQMESGPRSLEQRTLKNDVAALVAAAKGPSKEAGKASGGALDYPCWAI